MLDRAIPEAGRTLLARAKAQWLIGDWDTLASLDETAISVQAERDRLSLLVACAHLQRDRQADAAHYLRLALHWGCDPNLAARLLVSGVHNSLGRIAALRSDAAALERHFSEALAVTSDPDGSAAMHTRAVRELAQLGLVPQAAGLLQARAAALDTQTARPVELHAHVTMLRSEVELLQHELTLALQRNASLFAQRDGAEEASRAPPAADGQEAWRSQSMAQLGQDLWVLEKSGYKRGGYFVEFGATDGIRLSNTYLLERHFGWHGICCEPNPRFFQQLQANRDCITSRACVGARTGDRVGFVLAEEYGGMTDDMARDMHADKRLAYAADPANCVEFETISLHDLLRLHAAPREIDYLSIDTEGSEYAILAAFPFDHWRIRLITVEHNFSELREPLRQLLEGAGYRRTEARWDDWYELP